VRLGLEQISILGPEFSASIVFTLDDIPEINARYFNRRLPRFPDQSIAMCTRQPPD
jgi:hypothetical protein